MTDIKSAVSLLEIVPGKRGANAKPTPWTEAEDAILREHYSTKWAKGCSQMLQGRSEQSCHARAKRLGLSNKANWWTPEQDQLLRERYPTEGTAPICAATGRSQRAVMFRAMALGIRCEAKAKLTAAAVRKALGTSADKPPVKVALRRKTPDWPPMPTPKQAACDNPIITSETRVTIAPPIPDRWAVKNAPRVVDSSACRDWAANAAARAAA